MLLLCQKPSSLYSLLKFVYVSNQLRHPLVMYPLPRKILDPLLHARDKTTPNCTLRQRPVQYVVPMSQSVNETRQQHFHMVAVLLATSIYQTIPLCFRMMDECQNYLGGGGRFRRKREKYFSRLPSYLQNMMF